jgi:hypothetical protein
MFSRCLLISLFAFSLIHYAQAEEAVKPDDTVAFDVMSEDWVITKTAHVVLDVEASVSATNAGTMRADMIKAVNDVAKGDWRLINFSRNQDQTGLERWSVNFESRLPENELSGLADAAKKASKAGMQITVGAIDFSPTLEETEATRSALRAKALKQAADQLVALNAALPGRNYRIAQITFDIDDAAPPPPVPMMRHNLMVAGVAGNAMPPAPPPAASESMERSEKITLTAHVTYAALPPAPAVGH